MKKYHYNVYIKTAKSSYGYETIASMFTEALLKTMNHFKLSDGAVIATRIDRGDRYVD